MNAELTMPLSNRDPQNTRTDVQLLLTRTIVGPYVPQSKG